MTIRLLFQFYVLESPSPAFVEDVVVFEEVCHRVAAGELELELGPIAALPFNYFPGGFGVIDFEP
jgi:hypothetical protein